MLQRTCLCWAHADVQELQVGKDGEGICPEYSIHPGVEAWLFGASEELKVCFMRTLGLGDISGDLTHQAKELGLLLKVYKVTEMC